MQEITAYILTQCRQILLEKKQQVQGHKKLKTKHIIFEIRTCPFY